MVYLILIGISIVPTDCYPSDRVETSKNFLLDIGGVRANKFLPTKKTIPTSQKESISTWNPKEFRFKKLNEFKTSPMFLSIRYWDAEGIHNGELIRICFKTLPNGKLRGILIYQSPERGFQSYFSEKVTNNISGEFLQKISKKAAITKADTNQADQFFVHIFELKGTVSSIGTVTFETMKVAFDENFQIKSYSFKGNIRFKNGLNFLTGKLVEYNIQNNGFQFTDEIEINSPLIK